MAGNQSGILRLQRLEKRAKDRAQRQIQLSFQHQGAPRPCFLELYIPGIGAGMGSSRLEGVVHIHPDRIKCACPSMSARLGSYLELEVDIIQMASVEKSCKFPVRRYAGGDGARSRGDGYISGGPYVGLAVGGSSGSTPREGGVELTHFAQDVAVADMDQSLASSYADASGGCECGGVDADGVRDRARHTFSGTRADGDMNV